MCDHEFVLLLEPCETLDMNDRDINIYSVAKHILHLQINTRTTKVVTRSGSDDAIEVYRTVSTSIHRFKRSLFH